MTQLFLRWLLRVAPIALITLSLIIIPGLLSGEPISMLRSTIASCVGVSLMVMVTLWWWRGYLAELQLTEQEDQLQKEYHRFLERLDHELKNPITAIGLATSLTTSLLDECGEVGRDQCDWDDLTAANANIKSQNKRLDNLVTNLRKISQIAHVELDMVQLNLEELLQDRFEMIKRRTDSATRRLSIRLPTAPWPLSDIEGDYGLLDTAFKNVLDNALKFTTTGDTIELSAREEKGRVFVTISDTGRGIDPDDLPYIWDDLYRPAASRDVEGSGLGLAMTRAIVERHGGRISAKSRKGEGTQIVIDVPITQT